MKHKWTALNSPVVYGAAAAAVCMYSVLQMRKCTKKTIGAKSSTSVPVGILYLHHPSEFLHVLRNDILIEKAVENVSERLYVYVDDAKVESQSKRLEYLGEMYNLLWNVACCQGKFGLDLLVVSSSERAWSDVLQYPDLHAVFGYDGLDVANLNQDRQDKRVIFFPLTQFVDRAVNPKNFIYLEDAASQLLKEPLVVIGGTFDHLHNGHKKLLSFGAAIANNGMLIGVTAPHMLEKKSLGFLIEPLEVRKRNVKEYLSRMHPHVEPDIITIDDPFGPAITSSEVTAIVVSTETQLGAVRINEIRSERQLEPLRIYVCRRTDASTLSSSFIREQLAKRL